MESLITVIVLRTVFIAIVGLIVHYYNDKTSYQEYLCMVPLKFSHSLALVCFVKVQMNEMDE